MSLARKQERMRRETVNRTMLAIADWLEAHAKGKLADFYCPSKSGDGAAMNAAACLRAMVVGTPFPRCGQAGVDYSRVPKVPGPPRDAFAEDGTNEQKEAGDAHEEGR